MHGFGIMASQPAYSGSYKLTTSVDAFSYTHSTTVSSFITGHIVNVVPADFNYDGRLDVLLMAIGKDEKQLDLSIHLGDGHNANFCALLSVCRVATDFLGSFTSGCAAFWAGASDCVGFGWEYAVEYVGS